MSTTSACSKAFREMRATTEPGPPGAEARDRALIAEFCGTSADYYADRFTAMLTRGWYRGGINAAAMLGGAVWAAARGLWWLFWVSLTLELIALILVVNGLMP